MLLCAVSGISVVRQRRYRHLGQLDDHLVRDRAALKAAHPVRQHRLRHPAEHLEALGQERQRRLRLLILREPDETEPLCYIEGCSA